MVDLKLPLGVKGKPDCELCKGFGQIGQRDIYGYVWSRRCPRCNEHTDAEKRWTSEWAA